jgi:hypothetical protein
LNRARVPLAEAPPLSACLSGLLSAPSSFHFVATAATQHGFFFAPAAMRPPEHGERGNGNPGEPLAECGRQC